MDRASCQGCQAVQLTLDLLIEALIHHEKCSNCYGNIGGEIGISTLGHAVNKIKEIVEKTKNEDKN